MIQSPYSIEDGMKIPIYLSFGGDEGKTPPFVV